MIIDDGWSKGGRLRAPYMVGFTWAAIDRRDAAIIELQGIASAATKAATHYERVAERLQGVIDRLRAGREADEQAHSERRVELQAWGDRIAGLERENAHVSEQLGLASAGEDIATELLQEIYDYQAGYIPARLSERIGEFLMDAHPPAPEASHPGAVAMHIIDTRHDDESAAMFPAPEASEAGEPGDGKTCGECQLWAEGVELSGRVRWCECETESVAECSCLSPEDFRPKAQDVVK